MIGNTRKLGGVLTTAWCSLYTMLVVFLGAQGIFFGQEIELVLPDVLVEDQEQSPQLLWAGPNRVYAGQSSIYSLLLEGSTTTAFPTNISIKAPEDSVFEEVYGVGSIREKIVDGQKRYTIPIASFVLTPGREGDLTIPEASIRFDTEEYAASSLLVNVDSVPRIVHGIGQLAFFYDIDKTRIRPGETATITIRFQGEGNIPFINFEGPQSETAVVSLLDDNYTPEVGFFGYTGTRTVRYEVSASAESDHQIIIPSFTVYDIVTENYSQQSGTDILLGVYQQRSLQQNVSQGDEPIPTSIRGRLFHVQVYQRENILLILLVPVFLGCIAVCIRLIRSRNRKS